MKAGMQQRRKTAIRDRDREQGNAEFKTDRRGAERERERDIERKRTDKQTDRQTDRETEKKSRDGER